MTTSRTSASRKCGTAPKKIRTSLAALCCIVLLTLPAWSVEPIKKVINKTGEVVTGVAETITDPILNPRKAVMTWFDYNPAIESGEKKNYNILPLFVSSPERGQGFGIKYAQESLFAKKDVIWVQAVQTLKNKSSFEFKYEFPPDIIHHRIGAEFFAAFENYTKFYYGLGNASQKENESDFTPEYTAVRLPILLGITNEISLGVKLNYENWNIQSFGTQGILPADLPTLIGKDGSRLYTTSLLFRWDKRDSKTDPTQGGLLQAEYEYSKKFTGSETDFKRTTVEGRAFLPLFWKESHVVAARIYMDYKKGDVPFYHLPELGGIFFNRGLIEGRFRDNLAVCGNWEYRFRIYQRLHWAFFVDGGNVFNDFKSVRFSKAKYTGGMGMRYYVPPGNLLLARVDGGYSTEGFLLYLTFDHPF